MMATGGTKRNTQPLMPRVVVRISTWSGWNAIDSFSENHRVRNRQRGMGDEMHIDGQRLHLLIAESGRPTASKNLFDHEWKGFAMNILCP